MEKESLYKIIIASGILWVIAVSLFAVSYGLDTIFTWFIWNIPAFILIIIGKIKVSETKPKKVKDTTPKSIRSLSLGILAFIFSILFFPLGFILSLFAIIFGAIDYGQKKKYALAGLVLGILSIIIAVAIIVLISFGMYMLAQAPWYERLFSSF